MIDLNSIQKEFVDWQDPLSLQLHEWIQTSQKMEKLREILTEPFFFQPMQCPVLERGWPWDKWVLTDYRALCQNFPIENSTAAISPFDNQPLTEEIPHTFGEQMIEVLNPERATALVPQELAVVVSKTACDEVKFTRYKYYWWTAQSVLIHYKILGEIFKQKEMRAKCENIAKQCSESISSLQLSSDHPSHLQTSRLAIEESDQKRGAFLQKLANDAQKMAEEQLFNICQSQQEKQEAIQKAQALNTELQGRLR